MPRPALRLLVLTALAIMAYLFFGGALHRNAPAVPKVKATPAPAPALTPAPVKNAASPALDPTAGTGALAPTDPAATGPRFAVNLPAAAAQKAAEQDPALQALAFAIRDYRAALGQNPVGSNPEIARALLGDNPSHTQFIRFELPVNAQGEIIDQWGTPYFFHQISGTRLDVYSAGPDRKMWTDDDEIVR